MVLQFCCFLRDKLIRQEKPIAFPEFAVVGNSLPALNGLIISFSAYANVLSNKIFDRGFPRTKFSKNTPSESAAAPESL